jgi:hypothetical protein
VVVAAAALAVAAAVPLAPLFENRVSLESATLK